MPPEPYFDFALLFFTFLYAWFCIEVIFRLIDWWKQPLPNHSRVERRLGEVGL